MRLPTLNGLRAFEAAARHLSMKLAAVELCVTASAVSQLVRTLEQELGVALFTRQHRRLSLTPPARELFPAVRSALRLLGDASERIRRPDSPGILTVSTSSFFAETWLVPRLPDFIDRFPDIDVRITTSSVLSGLGSGDADIAIRHGLGDYPNMVSDFLVAPPVVPVASPSLVSRLGRPGAPADLLGWPLIHDADRGAWAMWFGAHRVTQVAPTRGLSFDDPALLRSAIVAGQGVGLLPEPLIAPLIAEGTLLAVGPAALITKFAYYCVAPHANLERPELRAFRGWIRDQFAREGSAT